MRNPVAKLRFVHRRGRLARCPFLSVVGPLLEDDDALPGDLVDQSRPSSRAATW
jgi:hypothetical protein